MRHSFESKHGKKQFLLPPDPSTMQNISFKGCRRVMLGETIHLVFLCLPGRELTTQDHESSALTTRPSLLFGNSNLCNPVNGRVDIEEHFF